MNDDRGAGNRAQCSLIDPDRVIGALEPRDLERLAALTDHCRLDCASHVEKKENFLG
jgi:hypothetical protein